MKRQKLVWITGASSGIGAETALQMAADGSHILVTARSVDKLQDLAEKAGKLKGEITPMPCDVTQPEQVRACFEKIENEYGAVDLVLLNAGTYKADTAENFTIENFKNHMDLNVLGVANALEPVLRKFIERKAGHIAIVASVAGFRGLPKSLSYGPSKAALINMTEALYMECRPHGIKVQLVNPGFVKTPLTDQNDFFMPMLMPVQEAAKALIGGLESNRFEITFPWLFVFLTKLVGLLPNKAYLWLIGQIKR